MDSERPFQKLYMDLLGPYPRSKKGNIGLLVIVDHNTKFHFLHPLRKLTSKRISDFLEDHIFYTFGVPEVVLTDNGPQFKSGQFESFLTRFGVEHKRTAIYSPQANASERLNRSILAAIRAYVGSEHDKWDQNLNEISGALRSCVHRSTGFPPYCLAFGQNMILDGKDYGLLRKLNLLVDDTLLSQPDAMKLMRAKAKEQISASHDTNARRYNLRSRPIQFKVGDEVYARNFVQSNAGKRFNAKLAPVFIPTRIKKKLSATYYEIVDETGKALGTFHLKDLQKRAKTNQA